MPLRQPILFAAILFSTLIVCKKTEPEQDARQSDEVLSADSAQQSDTCVTDAEKSKERTTTDKDYTSALSPKNRILSYARNNPVFDAEKWLKSDFDFFKRTNPNQISEYDHYIKKMARRYGFDWRLIAAQIYAESNFKNVAKSNAGALGLMQVLPSTAKFMGTDPGRLLQPEVNIAVGCMYDQRMFSLWGRQTREAENRLAFSMASYNAGRGRVLKSFRSEDSLTTWERVHPHLPEETQSYVHKIFLKYDFYRDNVIP